MKFVKVLFNHHTIAGKTSWLMVIDNHDDLIKYWEMDARANGYAMLQVRKETTTGHLRQSDGRHIGLQRYLHAKAATAPEGKKIYPLFVAAELTNEKYLGMKKALDSGLVLQANPNGGWCDLNGYLKIWEGNIIETIDKSDLGFPLDDAIITADTLLLENDIDRGYAWHIDSVKKHVPNYGEIKAIYSLRSIDVAYIQKCLANCTNVFMRTAGEDTRQLDRFMQLFATLQRKNVYLYGDVKELKEKIGKHPLFEKNNNIHNITFIDYSQN